MFRALVYGLAVLHLGPGIAFALLAFGCEAPAPSLGTLCGKHTLASFGGLTAGIWLFMLVGLAALSLVQRARRAPPPATGLRLAALLAVLATGALVGAAGVGLSGRESWLLAIPGALAVAWLVLANPLACEPGRGRESGPGRGRESDPERVCEPEHVREPERLRERDRSPGHGPAGRRPAA